MTTELLYVKISSARGVTFKTGKEGTVDQIVVNSLGGLSAFIRRDYFTDEEWFDLIEVRRDLIKSHIGLFAVPRLDSLKFLRGRAVRCREMNFEHALRFDVSTSTGDKRFSLKTRGIFQVQPAFAVERIPDSGYCTPDGLRGCRDGITRVWGLTCPGFLWVLVTIGFVGIAGYKNEGYEQARTVEIVESDLPKIIAGTKEKPRQIWKKLGNVIKGAAERHELFYNQTRNLVRTIEIEELIFSLTPEQRRER